MGTADVPRETPKQADVRRAEPITDKVLDDLLGKPGKVTKKDGTTVSQGQVAEMLLPPNWTEGRHQGAVSGTSSYRDFSPPGERDVKICFFYRGRRMSQDASQAFSNLLKEPAHLLKEDEAKALFNPPLKEILRDKAIPDGFNLESAKTEVVNGKKVLIIEGFFPGIQERTRAMYIDSDGTGSAVQEVYYQAPKDKFMKHQPNANAAFKSIKWK